MRVGRVRKQAVAALAKNAAVKRQLWKAATEVERDAQRLAPVQTGALRRSITVVEVRSSTTGGVEYRVGWDESIADYGKFVEFGTEDTTAQPHLRPAAIRMRRR